MQIGVHKIEDEVDIAIVFSSYHILKSDNVLVSRQFLQENNLAEGSLSIRSILEGIKVLFKSDYFFGPFVNGFPDNTISSLSCLQTSTNHGKSCQTNASSRKIQIQIYLKATARPNKCLTNFQISTSLAQAYSHLFSKRINMIL